jgi:hypothetical protein
MRTGEAEVIEDIDESGGSAVSAEPVLWVVVTEPRPDLNDMMDG